MYPELDNPADGVANKNSRSIDIHANSSGVHEAFKANIPPRSGVTQLVEQEEGNMLDKTSPSYMTCLHVPFCWT